MLLTANGGDGDDVLIGSAGNDTLNGGAGDDVLIGGRAGHPRRRTGNNIDPWQHPARWSPHRPADRQGADVAGPECRPARAGHGIELRRRRRRSRCDPDG